jgi:hypothetical protein
MRKARGGLPPPAATQQADPSHPPRPTEVKSPYDRRYTFERIAVNPDQIAAWNLPTRPTKQTDSRAKGFGAASVGSTISRSWSIVAYSL